MLSRINKVNSYPSDLKHVFTNASGLSTGGSSSAKISSGGLGSLRMVGFGLSLTLPVSPPIMVFHKQLCDLDPAKPESEKENKFIGPSSSLSAVWKTKTVYYLFTFASPQFGIKPENLK